MRWVLVLGFGAVLHVLHEGAVVWRWALGVTAYGAPACVFAA